MHPSSVPQIEAAPASPAAAVYDLYDAGQLDDARLLRALRANHARAPGVFFERFSPHVERVLTRILGSDADVPAIVNEAFFRALERIGRLEDADALKRWLTAIAVNVAREHIRSRRRRGWLRFVGADDMPDPPAPSASPETAEAVRRLYAAFDAMPADERIALALRFVDGMELTEVAEACDVSLATIKRTLARSESRFVAISRRDPVLGEWLERGTRWASQ